MHILDIFKIAVKGASSDVFLKVGSVPKFRRNGDVVGLKNCPEVSAEHMRAWLDFLVPAHLKQEYQKNGTVNFAYQSDFDVRFRVNIFRQNNCDGLVARVINSYVRSFEELQLPTILDKICGLTQGLVLVTGAVGSGKSSTLAAMIDRINHSERKHILTLEDPIEFIYKDRMALINQREVGLDVPTFEHGLYEGLRQNPDILLIGEIRDTVSMRMALQTAETGVLVFATLHTMGVVETILRMLSFYPADQRGQILFHISQALKFVICQKLLPDAEAKSLVLVAEYMHVDLRIQELIQKNNIQEITEIMCLSEKRSLNGCHGFDQSLLDLFNSKRLSLKMVMTHARRPAEVYSTIRGMEAA